MNDPTNITANLYRTAVNDSTTAPNWSDEATAAWMTAADNHGVVIDDETYDGLDDEYDAAGVKIDGEWYRIVVGKSLRPDGVELRAW